MDVVFQVLISGEYQTVSVKKDGIIPPVGAGIEIYSDSEGMWVRERTVAKIVYSYYYDDLEVFVFL